MDVLQQRCRGARRPYLNGRLATLAIRSTAQLRSFPYALRRSRNRQTRSASVWSGFGRSTAAGFLVDTSTSVSVVETGTGAPSGSRLSYMVIDVIGRAPKQKFEQGRPEMAAAKIPKYSPCNSPRQPNSRTAEFSG